MTDRPAILPSGPILPGGLKPLKSHKPSRSTAYDEIKSNIQEGLLDQAAIIELFEVMPTETLRSIVQKVSGTDASFLMTFNRQVQLVEAVLGQLVYPDGRIKPGAEDADISLKDAMTLSARVSQMMLRDLPKLYTVDRIQRWEQAIGDVMEEFMTQEQQSKVLTRLQELTGE